MESKSESSARVPSFPVTCLPAEPRSNRFPSGEQGSDRSSLSPSSPIRRPTQTSMLSIALFSTLLSYENKEKCRGTDSNCRHRHFQCRALPPELPRRGLLLSNPSRSLSRRRASVVAFRIRWPGWASALGVTGVWIPASGGMTVRAAVIHLIWNAISECGLGATFVGVPRARARTFASPRGPGNSGSRLLC